MNDKREPRILRSCKKHEFSLNLKVQTNKKENAEKRKRKSLENINMISKRKKKFSFFK